MNEFLFIFSSVVMDSRICICYTIAIARGLERVQGEASAMAIPVASTLEHVHHHIPYTVSTKGPSILISHEIIIIIIYIYREREHEGWVSMYVARPPNFGGYKTIVDEIWWGWHGMCQMVIIILCV